MVVESKEMAVQTRVRAGIASEFAEKCEKAGLTQKEVLNRMIMLFNQLGTSLFNQLSLEEQIFHQVTEESITATIMDEELTVSEAVVSTENEVASTDVQAYTDVQSISWFLVNPFGKELRLRSV